MTNTVTIACQIGTTDASIPLGLEVWVNDHKFFDADHVQALEKISVDLDDNEAEHKLQFVMKNKTRRHTQLDAEGNIVKDARLIISNLTFDEIELGHMFNSLAVYEHDFNGTGQQIQDRFYGEIGCNGTVSLSFSTPIYLWLLENM